MTITLVTGANKGLGHETARLLLTEGHAVYVGARSPERGEPAAAELGARFVQLDVTDAASVDAAMRVIDEREGRLDVLVNNAGVWDRLDGADGLTAADAFDQFDTNAVGVVRVTQAALPLLRRSENPVVVNVSSGLGSFAMVTDPDSHQFDVHSIVYSATKAAIDMLTVRYAQALPTIKFNAVDPGRLAPTCMATTPPKVPRSGPRSWRGSRRSPRTAPPAPSNRRTASWPGESCLAGHTRSGSGDRGGSLAR